MDLQTFSRDWVPLFQLIITTLALISILLLWWQIRESRLWNKLHTKENYADAISMENIAKQMRDALAKLKIDIRLRSEKLSEQEVRKIMGDPDADYAVRTVLNDIENLCAAIQIGAADADLCYAVHSTRVVRAYKIFKPYIEQLREQLNDSEIYIELEKVGLDWQKKQMEFEVKQKQTIEQLQENLLKSRGTKGKV
jgi:hypothetical protein